MPDGIKFELEDKLRLLLKRYPNILGERMKEAITELSIKVETEAKRMVRVDTGRLRSSITHRVQRTGVVSYEGLIGTNTQYAPHLEYGTKAHIITPRSARVLAAPVSAKTADASGFRVSRLHVSTSLKTRRKSYRSYIIFGKQVKHPGTKPMPFLHPALDTIKPKIAPALKAAMLKAWKDTGGSTQ